MKLLLSLLAAVRATDADECAPANEKVDFDRNTLSSKAPSRDKLKLIQICKNMSKVPDKADAVCGSDGITYSNQVRFLKKKSRFTENLVPFQTL